MRPLEGWLRGNVGFGAKQPFIRKRDLEVDNE
jgi:hypothetical protein